MELIIKILKKLRLYEFVRKIYLKRKKKSKLSSKYVFEDRSKGHKKMCMILAGYKMFCADIVFKRIKQFIPKDIDVCVMSSGKYSEELSQLAKDNNWSYLSTKRNCVSLIQNIAVNLFKKAEYIYKLDEDIFVTKSFFSTLMDTYQRVEKESNYKIGFVTPIITINGFCHLNILERLDLISYYEKKFEKPYYEAGPHRKIESDPEVAKFFWGYQNKIPQIDKLDSIFNKDKFNYKICPIRFSIGAILFSRSVFEEMGMFDVPRSGPGMGNDEVQICDFCMEKSKAIIVSQNTAVGHLSFGTQNKPMEEYFLKHKNVFDMK